ncbi:hypothetical protein [Alistipes senegalensis]|jgi:lipoprotein|uniref:hypothetical protein n=1 Tax=Alistipes senegalensis TaxID=1288121 RepID=UPI0018AB489C|nr:hypothetical protein [Alistipes senegalensis]
MNHKLLIFGVVAMMVLTSCNNQQKIENWEPALFESVGAPFLKRPTRFIEFHGPYADGENNDGVFFSFETKNHKQSFNYLEQCVKGVLKYADAIYDLSGNGRDRSKFTIDYLQQYAVDKKNVRINGSQWAGAYHYDLIFSKDGKYFEFSGGVGVYNSHERADCSIGFYPLSHLSAL